MHVEDLIHCKSVSRGHKGIAGERPTWKVTVERLPPGPV